MIGNITGRHVLRHPWLILREFGVRCYLCCLRAVFVRGRTTFLACAFPVAPGGTSVARRLTRLVRVVALGAACSVVAVPAAAATDRCAAFDHEHTAWTQVLNRHVRGGVVDYAGLRREGQPALSAYLSSLASVCADDYRTWSRPQKLAFWINAYNAYTVRLILDHYPLESIRSIGLLPGAAFRDDFIPMEKLRGEAMSLNDIEHDILRKELGEPRIHFAIVCASRSCPVLRSEAYRTAALDRQLDEAARGFVRDFTRNRLDAATRTLWLSSIFDWFREDFERSAGTVEAFVARYADAPTTTAIRAGGVRVKFLDYDWSLNGK